MFALKNGPENSKDRYQHDGSPEGYQAAPHRRADAVGRIVSANVPTDVDPGADENEEDRFYGPSSTVIPLLKLKDDNGYSINPVHKSNQ